MNEPSDSEKIEILIDQVGRMTKSITELRMSVEHGFGEVRSQFTELKAVSERQECNIDRLIGVVETLIQAQRSGS